MFSNNSFWKSETPLEVPFSWELFAKNFVKTSEVFLGAEGVNLRAAGSGCSEWGFPFPVHLRLCSYLVRLWKVGIVTFGGNDNSFQLMDWSLRLRFQRFASFEYIIFLFVLSSYILMSFSFHY